MAKTVLKVLIAGGIAAAIASFAGFDFDDAETIAAAHHLTDDQTQAFVACRRQMKGKGLETRNAHGVVKRNTVPVEICACQARAMADTFKPGKFEAHQGVIDHNISGAPLRPLEPAALVHATLDAAETFRSLTRHLAECINAYQQEQEAKTEAVKQKLILRKHDATL